MSKGVRIELNEFPFRVVSCPWPVQGTNDRFLTVSETESGVNSAGAEGRSRLLAVETDFD
jgi:hypothetical protein